MFYIYKITNKTNGKIYIGKTNDLYQRFHSHKHSVLKVSRGIIDEKTQYIHRAMNRYGIENFSIEIIYQAADHNECLDKEIELITFFDSTNRSKGYNLTRGGEGALGRKHTEQAIELMRQKATGRLHSEETKLKISQIHAGKGKKLTAEKVLEIRKLHENGQRYASIAKLFNISKVIVRQICLRQKWKTI